MTDLPQRAPADTDLARMDDDEFLDMCKTVRETKESMPSAKVPCELLEEFERVNREFMRRAGIAWRAATP